MAKLALLVTVSLLLIACVSGATVTSLLDYLDSTAAVPVFVATPQTSLPLYAPIYDSNGDNVTDNFCCTPLPQALASQANGKAVMVTRGKCQFQFKADNAVAAELLTNVAVYAKVVVVVNNQNGLFTMIVKAPVPVFMLDPEQLGANYGAILNKTLGANFTISFGPSIGFTGTPRNGELPIGLGILDIANGSVTLKSSTTSAFKFIAGWKTLETTRGSDRNYLWVANADNSQNISIWDVSTPTAPTLLAQFKPTNKAWLSFDEFDFLKNGTQYLLYVSSLVDGQWLVYDVTNLPTNGVEPTPIVTVNATIQNKGYERTPNWVFCANGTISGKDANQIVVYSNTLNPAIQSTYIDTTPNGGTVNDTGAGQDVFVSKLDGSLLFASWGADGVTGYKVLSAAPYLTKFATVYGTTGTADYSTGPQTLAYSLTQDVLMIGAAAVNDSARLWAYKINPADGSVIGNRQEFIYPSCGSAAYPAACSESFPVMTSSVTGGNEYVAVDHDRGVQVFQVNAGGQLISLGNFASRCSFVQFTGYVGTNPLVINGLSPKCTCPSLSGACPMQIRLEVTDSSTPKPTSSSSVLSSTGIFAVVALLVLLMFTF